MTARRVCIQLAFFAPVVVAVLLALTLAKPASSVEGLTYPDLGMAKLTDFVLDRPGDGRVLLRFTTTIVNVGDGPMELVATRSSTAEPFSAAQKIYGAGGSVLNPTPGAQLFYSGDGHNHWHVTNIAQYELDRLDNGVKVGTGAKSGFCFFDTTAYRTSLPGAPPSSVYRTTNACAYNNPAATDLAMGISVGWGDKYTWSLPGQYVDVTGISPGKYRLVATADASGWFAETNESNNATWVDLSVTVHRKHGTSIRIISSGPGA